LGQAPTLFFVAAAARVVDFASSSWLEQRLIV
jgi:hypothetical protein